MLDFAFIMGWVLAYGWFGAGFFLLVDEHDGTPDPVYCALWLPIILIAAIAMVFEWIREQA